MGKLSRQDQEDVVRRAVEIRRDILEEMSHLPESFSDEAAQEVIQRIVNEKAAIIARLYGDGPLITD